MNIAIGDRFKLNQSPSCRFDLIEIVTRKKKDSEETYPAESVIGYDMTLENAINRIILEKMKSNEETVTFREFLDEYKKEKEEIEKLIKL